MRILRFTERAAQSTTPRYIVLKKYHLVVQFPYAFAGKDTISIISYRRSLCVITQDFPPVNLCSIHAPSLQDWQHWQ